ncbi:MAG: hypothetical protein RLZZ338_2586 [Cyanobacteriota bacterium]|jgi:aryl-alcohol dehydrogenase-like predicted oxidoreductase
MRYKLLGKSGLRVSELCLGTMTFGEAWKDWKLSTSKSECHQIFETFVEEGGNFIDTANNYNNGQSELWVGEFISSDRDHFVLATKYTLSMRPGDPNFCGNHRKNMIRSVEASLKRLGTDYIDVLWLHAWDFMTPIEEVMRALDDLVKSGKVLYVGISDAPAWIISQGNTLAQFHGWSPFIGLQIEYSLAQREAERELLPMAKAFDIGVTAWSPLAGGILTGKYHAETSSQGELNRYSNGGQPKDEKKLKLADAVCEIARNIGHPPSQVALNWLRQQKVIIIPIIGARKVSQIKENLNCLQWKLRDEHLKQLHEVSKIELGFPYDFLSEPFISQLVYGGTLSSIDNHHI